MVGGSHATVSFRVQARAFSAAVARFRRASGKQDDQEAWAALHEALTLATTLADRISRESTDAGGKALTAGWLAEVPGAEALLGIRWARNALTHQFADALELVSSHGGRFPRRAQDWIWRPIDEVGGIVRTRSRTAERDHTAEQRKSYKTYLAGRPADFTLSVLDECFDEAVERLGVQ